MPIDDALEEITGSEGGVRKPRLTSKAPYLLPVRECVAVYQTFLEVSSYFADHEYKIVDAGQLSQAFQRFLPVHREFYKVLRDGLDGWQSSLTKVCRVIESAVEAPPFKAAMSANIDLPSSLYHWLLGETELNLASINEAAQDLEMAEGDEQDDYNLPLRRKAGQVNEMIGDLYEQRDVSRTVLVMRALHTGVNEVNNFFRVLKGPLNNHLALSAEVYLRQVEKLEDFSRDKKNIGYKFYDGSFFELEEHRHSRKWRWPWRR